MKCAKFVGIPTGRLHVIIAASIVVKRELAKKTKKYDTQTKAYMYQFELEVLSY